jgi:hypothetical protein
MLSIGQQVRVDATDMDGEPVELYGVVRGFDLGGVLVNVELPVHLEPEVFQYLTRDVERWQEA